MIWALGGIWKNMIRDSSFTLGYNSVILVMSTPIITFGVVPSFLEYDGVTQWLGTLLVFWDIFSITYCNFYTLKRRRSIIFPEACEDSNSLARIIRSWVFIYIYICFFSTKKGFTGRQRQCEGQTIPTPLDWFPMVSKNLHVPILERWSNLTTICLTRTQSKRTKHNYTVATCMVILHHLARRNHVSFGLVIYNQLLLPASMSSYLPMA